MSVNAPLLRKVLEHITEHPDEWFQGMWAKRSACGTACCVAGHVAVMTGHELIFDSDGEASFVQDGRWISTVATEELRLPDQDPESYEPHLFAGFNSLPDLWRIANELTDGEIEIPEGMKVDD